MRVLLKCASSRTVSINCLPAQVKVALIALVLPAPTV
jgi:hypothetical protein